MGMEEWSCEECKHWTRVTVPNWREDKREDYGECENDTAAGMMMAYDVEVHKDFGCKFFEKE